MYECLFLYNTKKFLIAKISTSSVVSEVNWLTLVLVLNTLMMKNYLCIWNIRSKLNIHLTGKEKVNSLKTVKRILYISICASHSKRMHFNLFHVGAWLAGMLKTGEIFLWNKDQDIIKTVPAIEESKKVAMAVQGMIVQLL